MISEKYILVLTTINDRSTAEKIARVLVEERLAACVSITSSVESIFWWKEKISQDQEYTLFIKTQSGFYRRVEEKILSLHPYETPEIIAVPIKLGSMRYFDWISEELDGGKT